VVTTRKTRTFSASKAFAWRPVRGSIGHPDVRADRVGSSTDEVAMKVVQVEFNELSPQLLADFMAAGELPNFSRFYETSQVFTTDAHAEPAEP
jgi:hypothetical protein